MSVVVWSRDLCAYCDMAKRELKKRNIEFEERKIGDGWTKEQLLEEIPNARTIPQIVIDGKIIGGYTELMESGILDSIIKGEVAIG
jgi:glutaredoxin 3